MKRPWVKGGYNGKSRLHILILKTEIPSDKGLCWNWLGLKNKDGYGKIADTTAHREAYRLFIGRPIPNGKCVCHSCDNPGCVNPDHLWLGTIQQNTADMDAKGRRHQGVRNQVGRRSCTKEVAIEARRRMLALEISVKEAAEIYNISAAWAGWIRRGQSWHFRDDAK